MNHGEAFIKAYPNASIYDYVSMVDKESDQELERRKMRRTARNIQDARDIAARRIMEWANSAGEFRLSPMSTFVASHRPACVWAVMIGNEAREGA